jgi:hypothetical protein
MRHRATAVLAASLAAALLACGCHTSKARSPVVCTFRSHGVRWPVPADLPTFGVAGADSIRVAVFGTLGAVNCPGYYHLPKGATVADALRAAQGLSEFVWWRVYSGIERSRRDGVFEVLEFTSGAARRIVLRDGDRVYFGHEWY